MRDRTPTRALENGALRYGVYAEDGSLLRYEYLALEDEPADPGTELSKATLLQDSTEVSLFGSAADRTVDEAFAGIAGQLKLIKSDMAAITLTVQDTNGKPIPEVLVQGILSESGQAVYTNASGVAAGYIGEGAQVIKVSGYADVTDHSETLTVVKGTTITKTWKLATLDFLKITSSKSVKFSGNVARIDVSVGGAGGGGAGGASTGNQSFAAGSGGGGGQTAKKENVAVSANVSYPAVVGAGGTGGKSTVNGEGNPGRDGGASSFLGVSAAGGLGAKASQSLTPGEPGTGNGNGGRGGWYEYTQNYQSGTDGTPGTGSIYKSLTEEESYGGGGGGGGSHSWTQADGGSGTVKNGKGGAPHGTDGGFPREGTPIQNAKANTGGGGGGGRAYAYENSNDRIVDAGTPGANGGSGVVAIRMHLKSAA